MEIEHYGTYPAIQSVVSQSVGVLLLCDAISVSRAPLNEDLSALKLVSRAGLKLSPSSVRTGRGAACIKSLV